MITCEHVWLHVWSHLITCDHMWFWNMFMWNFCKGYLTSKKKHLSVNLFISLVTTYTVDLRKFIVVVIGNHWRRQTNDHFHFGNPSSEWKNTTLGTVYRECILAGRWRAKIRSQSLSTVVPKNTRRLKSLERFSVGRVWGKCWVIFESANFFKIAITAQPDFSQNSTCI